MVTCWRVSDRLAFTDRVKVALLPVEFELDPAADATAAIPVDTGSMKITASSEYLRRLEDIAPPFWTCESETQASVLGPPRHARGARPIRKLMVTACPCGPASAP